MISGSQQVALTVESWGLTRRGRACRENQDAFLNWPEHLLWGVADGVGGSSDGAAASRLVVRNLMRAPAPPSLAGHVENVTRLLARSNRELRQGGLGDAASTVVVLLIHLGGAACVWSGDSRCYLLRERTLHQCTRDHTVRQRKIERKELTEHEAERMVRGNVVTNAVGVRSRLCLETTRLSLRRGDRFLLCSDGLSDNVSLEALATHLGRPRAKDAARGIAEALDERGHSDDATFVTVFVSGHG